MENRETELNAYLEKLKRYYDESGRLIQYPSKRPMRLLALTHIADRLDAARKYTEKEVNEIIKESIAFGDIELIRREMFQHKLIGRLKDGSAYWREETRENESEKEKV